MKQLVQDANRGDAAVIDVPAPQAARGRVLVRNAASLISAGTERMVLEFAGKSLIGKAKARPDLVRQVLEKAQREGVLTTLDAVRSRLDQPLSLGYSTAGTVLAVGEGVTEFKPGDRVSCAGANEAVHAEIISVPKLLVARIPDAPSPILFEHAAFATVGAIALQGIRLADVKLGETVAVIGLGLLGQLTVQMLKAAGCKVIGSDPQPSRTRLAVEISGADAVAVSTSEMAAICEQQTASNGVDAVLICADTPGNGPVELAGEIARDRATVVAVGAVGMQVPRRIYFEKELAFRVSRSYGPGRYDASFEEKGNDYPIGHVRWTETRNLQAFLNLIAEGRLVIAPLITHRFDIADARAAYDLIGGDHREEYLGVVIRFPENSSAAPGESIRLPRSDQRASIKTVNLGMIGAGAYASRVLLPPLAANGSVSLAGICSATGLSAQHAGTKFHFRYAASSPEQILADKEINSVVIATPHHLHASQSLAALRAGKNVFCEKPLCISDSELDQISSLYSSLSPRPVLMVGFNRRFSPYAAEMRAFVAASREPLVMQYRVNAGYLPTDHWTQDAETGGGRIIGEACHFIDFMGFLSGSIPVSVQALALPNRGRYNDDNVVVNITFADGSIGTLTYVANGDKSFAKERCEVFTGGSVAVLDDFRSLELVRGGRRTIKKSRLRQEKGQTQEIAAFVAAVREGSTGPIPVESIFATTRATFRIMDSIRTGTQMRVLPASATQSMTSELAK